MPDIFMSYAHADQPIARAIAVDLQGRGGSLRSHSMEKCEYFLLVFSPRAAASPRIRAETAAALLQQKKLCAVRVEDVPLSDFLFLLEVPMIELTQPQHTADALNALARLFALPEKDISPFDLSVFTPQAAGDEQSPPLTPDEQDNLFFTAAERPPHQSGEAMFLYRYLQLSAPDYAQGAISRFADQISVTLRGEWLKRLEAEAAAPLANSDWEGVRQHLERMEAIEPEGEAAERLRRALIDGQLEALWQKAQARAQTEGWDAVDDILTEMKAINPDDTRVLEMVARVEQETLCASIYQQAVKAKDQDRSGAVIALLEYINRRCPDYGDPQGLLSGSIIRPEYTPYLREIAVLSQHMGPVHTLAFSPDGTLLVSGGGDGTLRLWDMEGLQQVAVKRVEDTGVKSLSFSHDGMFLVSTTGGRMVYIWSMPEGREAVVMDDFKEDVVSAIFTPDNSALIIGYSSGSIEVVRIEDGLILSEMPAHEHGINAILFSPEINLIITASEDRLLKVWNFTAPHTIQHPPRSILKAHTMMVNGAALSHDQRLIASASNDGQVILWDGENGTVKAALAHDNASQVRAAAFSPQNSLLISGGVDRLVRLWDVERAKLIASLDGHGGSINALAFTPDGTTFASGSSDRTIRLWGLGSISVS